MGFKNPVGVYNARPEFSWKLPACNEVKLQSAYEVVAASDSALLPYNPDLRCTQKVTSERLVWVAYAGKPLKSRKRIYRQVRYWDQTGNVSSGMKNINFIRDM